MRDYKDFNFAQKTLLSVIQLIERWLFKRKWTYEDQVAFARRNIFDDKVWLSEFLIDKTICKRHEMMLSSGWYSTPHESPGRFRDQTLRRLRVK